MSSDLLSGLILSGGRSSRMGYDKSTISYHGKSQREFLFDILSPVCNTVYFSCKDKTGISPSLNPLEDIFIFDSPLNGILTAFTTKPNSAWISVPVDMPNVDSSVIQYLLDRRDASKIATCFYDSDGKHPEPLLTVWEPRAGEKLKHFFEVGQVSPRAFLMEHDVHVIPAPDAKILYNINSQADYKKFRDDFTPGT